MKNNFLTNKDFSKLNFKKIGKNVFISAKASIIGHENIEIGDNVRIDDFSIIVCKKGNIKIGNNVHIAAFCYLNGSNNLIIGNYCNFSQGVKIYTKSDNYDGSTLTNPTFNEKYTKPIKGPVIISKHSIFGSGTVIMPNIKIEEGVAVGALSLVKKNLKKWSIYAGVPVKLINKRKKITKKMEFSALNNI